MATTTPTSHEMKCNTDRVLTREAQSFLGRKETYPRRSANYTPTLEELQSVSFSDYVRSILFDTDGGRRRWRDGIAKVTLPEGWWDGAGIAKDDTGRGPQWQKGTKLGDMVVKGPIKQVVRGIGGVYEYVLLEQPPMTLSDFRERADAYRTKQIGSAIMGNDVTEDACDALARKFWKRVGPTMEPSMYGADMEGSLFDGAEASGWNLENLESCLQLLSADTDGRNLPGVTTPYLYFGMWASVFCAHTEDMNLLSINYLHAGAPKCWYAIAPEYAKRFESVAESHFAHAQRDCSEYLRHKQNLLSPAILKKAGVPFTMQIQRPGDAIITMPGGYHFGFNMGFNVAEATNFAVPEWLEKGLEAKACLCRPHSVHIDVRRFETLLKHYEEDLLNADTLGFPKLSYREWTMLMASRRKIKNETPDKNDGAPGPKRNAQLIVEVTPPLLSEAKRMKMQKRKRSKKGDEKDLGDRRIALPINSRRSLVSQRKVLCLLPGKDEAGDDTEQYFAGEISELAEGCVKVRFDGMQRKDDMWMPVDSPNMFLDGGRQSRKDAAKDAAAKEKAAKDAMKPKPGEDFWVEVTHLDRSKQPKSNEDWRLALPIVNRGSLGLEAKVLCLRPGKDAEGGNQLCFAGEVIKMTKKSVKVRLDGQDEEIWIANDSPKLFLDGGNNYYDDAVSSDSSKSSLPDYSIESKQKFEFVVEVTPSSDLGSDQAKIKQQNEESNDPNAGDWRLALPIKSRKALLNKSKVLCILPWKDENGVELKDPPCLAGEVVKMTETCVKVHLEGTKIDLWIPVDASPKIFVDGGRQYYN